MYPNAENMIVVPMRNGMEIIMSIQVCHISQMDFDYKENSGKKSFSYKSKTSVSCIPLWRHDYIASDKKNGDRYGYLSLSHFMDELRL